MAPLLRTCCGFLQLQSASRVANPRLFIRSGLKVGWNHLYGVPVAQVRESSQYMIEETHGDIHR